MHLMGKFNISVYNQYAEPLLKNGEHVSIQTHWSKTFERDKLKTRLNQRRARVKKRHATGMRILKKTIAKFGGERGLLQICKTTLTLNTLRYVWSCSTILHKVLFHIESKACLLANTTACTGRLGRKQCHKKRTDTTKHIYSNTPGRP